MRSSWKTIGGLMWLVVLAAIGCGLVLPYPEIAAGLAFGTVVAAVVAAVLFTPAWLWFVDLPRQSARLTRGDLGRQRRLLKTVLAVPFPFRSIKWGARYVLLANLKTSGRCEEGLALANRLLRDAGDRRFPAGMESHVRQQRADCLEVLGRVDEAERERKRSLASLAARPKDYLALLSEAHLVDREKRYDEAGALYEQALAVAPRRSRDIRFTILLPWALALFNAGRSTEAHRRAREAIEIDPNNIAVGVAYRLAALTASRIGRLDEAERLARLGVDRSVGVKGRAEALGLASTILLRLGRLDEAEGCAREAEALAPGADRLPWMMIGNIEAVRGRYDRALEAALRMESAAAVPIPALQRQSEAGTSVNLALHFADAGWLDKALDRLRAAEPEMRRDPKLRVEFEAIAAYVHAHRGEPSEALARMEQADGLLPTIADDPPTVRSALTHLAEAALRLDDPARAEAYLRRNLTLDPGPVARPRVLHLLATARRAQGDADEGRRLDREAAAYTFGTLHERLARERLAAET